MCQVTWAGIAQLVVPGLLALVGGIQVWTIKQLIECMKWRSKCSTLHGQHNRDYEAVRRLENKVDGGFERINAKLDALDRRCIRHISSIRQDHETQED
jgi:hypothetical protein